MAVPLPCRHFEVGLGIGENRLGTLQFLEGSGASDERSCHGFEPVVVLVLGVLAFEQIRVQVLFGLSRFLGELGAGIQVDGGQRATGQQQRVFTLIALPRVPLPLVPHAFGVIIDAPVTEEMGIEPAVSLFLITEALQYELQVRFRQVHRLFLHGGRWVAPKLEDLALSLGPVGLVTSSDGPRDRPLAIGFPRPGGPVPLVWAKETRLPEEAIHPPGILACPEGEQVAERELRFRLRGIAGRITFPQRAKCRAIPGMHRLLEHVVVGTLSGKSALIDVTTCRLHVLLSTCRDFRMDGAQLWASLDGRGCSAQVVAGHGEVAPFTVQLNGGLRT